MENRQVMVISVMDRDRPGIVAEITEGISALSGNLADLRESVLCGYFTMILVAGFPLGVTSDQVEQALGDGTTLCVSVKSADGLISNPEPSADLYVLSAVARDRVGLVAHVSRFCSNHGVNILDLASSAEDDQYTMMLQIDLAGIQSLDQFKTELTGFGKETGLNLELQHNDIFCATNEI